MAADDKSWRGRLKRWSKCLAWFWQKCLDFALVLWIVRVPLCAVVIGGLVLDYTVQAQDVLTEFSDHRGRMVFFLLLLTFVWAAPTHYTARLLLDTDSRFRAYAETHGSPFLTWAETWVPRMLGLAPYGVVLFASGRSVWNLPEIDDAGLIWGVKKALYFFDFLVVVAGIVFLAYMVTRHELVKADSVKRVEEKLGFVNRVLQWFGLGGDGRISARGQYRIHPGLGPLVLFFVFLVSALIISLGGNRAAALFPRALILPIIFGGWLPLLTFLSGWGRQLRAPLIVGSALVIAVLSLLFGDNHSIRRVDANALAKRSVDTSTMKLNRALDLWMKKNDCAGKPSSCPRPVIIVGAGGASRAGFFTASVIGRLLDDADGHSSQGQPLDAAKIRNRIFAISALSGSAPGAVMTVAAFAHAGEVKKQPPCTPDKPDLWYGNTVNKWQDCLEALMAGDFLTATVIGLTFHDTIRFGWWQDRAALLERSWERRFSSVMGLKRNDWEGGCPGDLRCPFLDLRPDEKREWLPLLLLNGASSETGRRVLTMVLDPDYAIAPDRCPTRAPRAVTQDLKDKSPAKEKTYATDDPGRDCPIFMEATPFHSLLKKQKADGRPGRNLNDVRLSTAALNSARFPIISPPGAVRNLDNDVVDRIVDGGYIENYGALTAIELAIAINALQPQLAPFVLVISNDPDENPNLNEIDVPDTVFLTDVFTPLQTVEKARTGRGRLAVQQLNAVLDMLTDRSCGADTAHIRVWPQYRQDPGNAEKKVSLPVSLSWWLSTPLQVHLHQQLESTQKNLETTKMASPNRDAIERTWRAFEATSACMAPRR